MNIKLSSGFFYFTAGIQPDLVIMHQQLPKHFDQVFLFLPEEPFFHLLMIMRMISDCARPIWSHCFAKMAGDCDGVKGVQRLEPERQQLETQLRKSCYYIWPFPVA